MKSRIAFALLLAAAVTPTSVLAADPSSAAPMLCRAAQSGESSNATMGTMQLACRPIDTTRRRVAVVRQERSAAESSSAGENTTQQTGDVSDFGSILRPYPGQYDNSEYR